MMDIQAAVFDIYGKSIFELQGFPVKFQITAYKEVYSSLRCIVYFLLILKVRMSLKNALCTSVYPSWVFILRALVLWYASQLFYFEVKKNLESSAFIIIGKRYGRLCVCLCISILGRQNMYFSFLNCPSHIKWDTVLI